MGLEFLCERTQSFFRPSTLRHVEIHADHAHRPPLVIVQHLAFGRKPPYFSVRSHHAKFMFQRAGFFYGPPHRLLHERQVIRMHPPEKLIGRRRHRTLRQPQQGEFLPIPPCEIGFHIDVPRPHLARTQRQPQALLALTQGFLHAPPIRDVDLTAVKPMVRPLSSMRHIGAAHIPRADPFIGHRDFEVRAHS